MRDLLDGFIQAFQLIMIGDPALYEAISLSLRVTGVALLFSTLVGIPLGAWMGLKQFPGGDWSWPCCTPGWAFRRWWLACSSI